MRSRVFLDNGCVITVSCDYRDLIVITGDRLVSKHITQLTPYLPSSFLRGDLITHQKSLNLRFRHKRWVIGWWSISDSWFISEPQTHYYIQLVVNHSLHIITSCPQTSYVPTAVKRLGYGVTDWLIWGVGTYGGDELIFCVYCFCWLYLDVNQNTRKPYLRLCHTHPYNSFTSKYQ